MTGFKSFITFAVLPVLLAAVLAAPGVQAQSSREAAALSLRLNQTEERLRRMTGRVEELTHRLQQMESRFRRFAEDTEFRFQQLGGKGKAGTRTERKPRAKKTWTNPPPAAPRSMSERSQGARGTGDLDRDDSFNDGGLDPARAGTVRSLGRVPGSAMNFDLGPGEGGFGGGAGIPDPAASAPANARESYDQAYGMILRRNYAGAEEAFHGFLNRFANDPLAGNAQYWLGESYYARGMYRDAADAFLAGYTKYKRSSKAPASLFKLGMTLLKLKQKSAACASFAELNRKFPRAPKGLKTRAADERRKAGC